MHLVVNASEIGRQRGGNETYTRGLLKGLSGLSDPPEVTALTCDWDEPVQIPERIGRWELGAYRVLPFWLWQQARALRRLHPDWYISNYYLPPLLPCRGAVVVHDVSFRVLPAFFPAHVAWYMHHFVGWSMRRADVVITVSDFSRQELIRCYGLPAEKIAVVSNGVADRFHPVTEGAAVRRDLETVANYGVTPPYLFALGNIHPRKNLARLLGAYARLGEVVGDRPTMVWGGIERWDSGDLVERARRAGVILTGFIALEDLPAFYRQAEMLVYPSLYEGFGLPPVEALACGTPVVTSSTTGLPEAVGGAALTVDPTSVSAIAGAMGRILDDPALREALRVRGLAQVRRFTWEKTAQRLVDALTQAA